MQLAFASLVGIEPMPFARLVARASEIGADGIEVNLGPKFRPIDGASFGGHLDTDAVVRGETGEIEEVLDRHGVRITALAPMLNLLNADEGVRSELAGYFRRAIDACVKLGVGVIVCYGGSPCGMYFWGMPGVSPNHPSNRVDEVVGEFKKVFTPLAAYAEERGVKIALETAPRGGGEGNIAHSPYLWDRIFEAVPNPAIGLSFDPSHLYWIGVPDVPNVIRTYRERVHHVDGKDAEILPDVLARQGVLGSGWWRYRLPGLGALDWAAILSALREIGYDHAIAIENEDPVLHGLAGVGYSITHLRRLLLPEPEARA